MTDDITAAIADNYNDNREFQRKVRVDMLKDECFHSGRLGGYTFERDDMKNPRLTGVLKRYAENFDRFYREGRGLLLYGKVGTGKTYAAAEIANTLIDREIPCFMTGFSQISDRPFDERLTYIESFDRYDLVIFDDLFAERDTEYMRETVYLAVNLRYESKKPMIITTNLSLDQIKNQADLWRVRVFDRILGCCCPVEVAGGSRRRAEANKNYNEMREILRI